MLNLFYFVFVGLKYLQISFRYVFGGQIYRSLTKKLTSWQLFLFFGVY